MGSDIVLRALAATAHAWRDPDHEIRVRAVRTTLGAPNRFTEEALAYAINQQMHQVTVASLTRWVDGRFAPNPKSVGVLGAGNVPLASFQDYLAVTASGHRYFGSESSRSPALLPAFAAEVADRGGPQAVFMDHGALLNAVDALVASGSTETMATVDGLCASRGIDPGHRLLRGTRFGVAILDGRENPDQRIRWAEDSLLHEGQGCRNVAISFAPRGLDADPYLDSLAVFRGTFPAHPGTCAGLKMQLAFLKAVKAPHAHGDGLEFLVSRGTPEPQPPGHLRWVEYDSPSEIEVWLAEHGAEIQVVATRPALRGLVPPGIEHCPLGETQRPPLDWMPDGRDTIDFLARL